MTRQFAAIRNRALPISVVFVGFRHLTGILAFGEFSLSFSILVAKLGSVYNQRLEESRGLSVLFSVVKGQFFTIFSKYFWVSWAIEMARVLKIKY